MKTIMRSTPTTLILASMRTIKVDSLVRHQNERIVLASQNARDSTSDMQSAGDHIVRIALHSVPMRCVHE